jgi:addiction module HigA family antidote
MVIRPPQESDVPAVHPGEVLLHDFIDPLGITRYRVEKAIGVPQRRINEICMGTRGITSDTALRLGRFFGMEAAFWLNLQNQYDLEATAAELGARLDAEVSPLSSTAESRYAQYASSRSGEPVIAAEPGNDDRPQSARA